MTLKTVRGKFGAFLGVMPVRHPDYQEALVIAQRIGISRQAAMNRVQSWPRERWYDPPDERLRQSKRECAEALAAVAARRKSIVDTEYSESLPDYGELMTVEEFRDACRSGCFIDYDGHGRAVKDGKMVRNPPGSWGGNNIYPSDLSKIPDDATHIMWFNR